MRPTHSLALTLRPVPYEHVVAAEVVAVLGDAVAANWQTLYKRVFGVAPPA